MSQAAAILPNLARESRLLDGAAAVSRRPKISAATVQRELRTFKRRAKRFLVEAGQRGWISPAQARTALRVLGLRRE